MEETNIFTEDCRILVCTILLQGVERYISCFLFENRSSPWYLTSFQITCFDLFPILWSGTYYFSFPLTCNMTVCCVRVCNRLLCVLNPFWLQLFPCTVLWQGINWPRENREPVFIQMLLCQLRTSDFLSYFPMIEVRFLSLFPHFILVHGLKISCNGQSPKMGWPRRWKREEF